MDARDWGVVALGAAAIAWVNWYFLLARRSEGVATRGQDAQEIEILVRGGYDPAVVRVKRGVRVRLVFNRQDTSSCSEEIVIPDFGVRRFLPSGEKTAVEVTPTRNGEFDITCGMSMLHGKLVVEG